MGGIHGGRRALCSFAFSLGRLDARRFVAGDVGEALPRLDAAPGAWLGFWTGLTAAAGAVGVLFARAGRGGRSTQEGPT